MRRFLTLFTMLMLCGILASAQTRVVSGRIIDKDGNSVPFASVKIKGSKSGAQADANGVYTIKVKDDDVLEVSAAGFKVTQTVVGTSSSVTTVMDKGITTDLKEVVVTGAFNTKRTARSVASNSQVISADALNTVRSTDVNNALAGKVAGVQVRSQSSAALGRATVIRLRGENGFGVGAGALYVVDGTIVPNSNDINTDDIEDLTVLQGPSAAALFGSEALGGAIVITTKKAKKGQKNLGIEINSGVQFDKVYVVPNYQNEYAGGDAGQDLIRYTWEPGQPEAWKALDGKFYHDYENDASWGPRMVGQEYIPWYAWYPGTEDSYKTAKLTPQPNNIRNYYNTGVTKINNINFSKSGEGFSARVSYTNLDQKSIIPTQFLKRHTFNASLSMDLSSRITVATNINYIAQNSNTENDDTYGNQSSGSFSSWFHRDLDMNKLREYSSLKDPFGNLASWNHLNPTKYNTNPGTFYEGNYWFNHYAYFDNVNVANRRDRLFGDISFTYKFNNDFKIRATYRKQQLTTVGTSTYSSILQKSVAQGSFNPYEGNANAGYGVSNSYSDRQNYELLASYSKKIKSFAVNVNAGIDILKTRQRTYNANTFGGLSVDGLYSLANSVGPVENSLSASKSQEAVDQFLRRSPFIRADIGFKNLLFVEGTFRRDYASTEQPSKPYVNSKSVGASFVFSDLIKNQVPFLSYGKIRASTGEIVQLLGTYDLGTYYIPNAAQYNGNLLETEPNTLVSPTLHGAVNKEKEIGIDIRVLKNRVGVSATYYARDNTDFPATISIPSGSGYSFLRTNVGKLSKRGVELQVSLQPIKKENLIWDINATWGRLLKNEIVDIDGGITKRIVSASGDYGGTYAPQVVSEQGKQWGQLFGTGIKRVNGIPVINDDGTFVPQTQMDFGSVLPDYTGGVQNKFTVFKNFTININIDYSVGGKFFSLSDYWGTYSGLTQKTATLNDKGNPVRDPIADGGGVHVTGVDNTDAHKPVDMYVSAYDYYHQFPTTRISEPFIYDLTFVKVREVSIGYRIPVETMKIRKYFSNATFSLMLRNPWLIYAKVKDFDPSEISQVQGEGAQFPSTRSFGINLKLGF